MSLAGLSFCEEEHTREGDQDFSCVNQASIGRSTHQPFGTSAFSQSSQQDGHKQYLCSSWGGLLRRESTVQAKTTSRFHYSADSLQVV